MTTATLLVTGANRGLGLETTEQFAADGWAVLACCRNPAAAEGLRRLSERYPAIEVLALDVTDFAQMQSLSAQLHDRPIDVLLSNAGIYGSGRGSFDDVDPAEWVDVLEVNTIAPFMLARAFVEQVAASQQKLIAVISSKVGSIADNSSGGSYLYRSSKTAVNQVVKSLSIDLASRDISVISLHPGWVQTDMGGSNAEITTATSVAGLKSILQAAGLPQSGHFIEFNGDAIPW
jgi:NAD(P)-dependent dehydrogenase (short-subunit alcohol dehydrogenase family)